ncbi:11147_t:CDS:2 [Diversispora eburnea]|uniref:11147_t:CDS:1 n=1 Tax=Diversispora eburnea TaxID=1213867 RepID=A0A9N8VDQ6_9GLOM|nr:11147_t:CDS:2 [Diversispora eburnea]
MPKMKKCCCCLNLKPGVLIISVIELLVIALAIFATIVALCNHPQRSDSVYTFNKEFSIVSLIVYFPLFVGFFFGLFVSIQERRVDLIKRYALIIYAYIFVSVAMYIASIIITMNQRKKYCKKHPEYDCTDLVLIVYFARVVSAYAEQTELLLKQNTPQNTTDQVRVTFALLPNKRVRVTGQFNTDLPIPILQIIKLEISIDLYVLTM